MAAPRWLARFNRRVTNRLTTPLVGRLPGFGLVEHEGRKTHRRYRTPVLAFRRSGGYVIALTYGPGTDWVQNVLAEGGCTLVTNGRRLRLSGASLLREEHRRPVPPAISLVLNLAGISDFLELRDVTTGQMAGRSPCDGSGAPAARGA
jgi:deazaflavin-dependent oxidoreductase (nitroreductase family)